MGTHIFVKFSEIGYPSAVFRFEVGWAARRAERDASGGVNFCNQYENVLITLLFFVINWLLFGSQYVKYRNQYEEKGNQYEKKGNQYEKKGNQYEKKG